MNLKRFYRPRYLSILLLLAIVCQLGLIAFYQYNYFFTSAAMDSDAAAEILLAEYMYDSGGFIVSDGWFYSTEVRVLHNHLVMQPLFFFTRDYRLIATLAAVIIAGMIAASVYFCIRGTQVGRTSALLAALLAIIPYGIGQRSGYYALYIANAYYAFFMIGGLVLLGLYLRVRRPYKARPLLAVLMAVLAVFMGLSGMRYALILVLPLLVAQFMELLYENRTESISPLGAVRAMAPAILVAVGFALGYAVNLKWLLPVLEKSTKAEEMRFIAGTGELATNSTGLLANMLTYLGFSVSGGKLVSFQGVLNMVLFAFTIFTYISAVALLRKLSTLETGVRFYVIFAWCAMLINGIVLCLIDKGVNTARYTHVGLFWLLPCVVLNGFPALKKKQLAGVVAAGLSVFVLASANVQLFTVHYPYQAGSLISYDANYTGEHLHGTIERREGYLEFLQAKGYTLGASDFWDAQITTVYTNGAVRMINVRSGDEPYRYSNWLMPKEYRDIELYQPQFILLTTGKAQERWDRGYDTPGAIVFRDENFIVFDLGGLDLSEIVR